MDSVHIKEFGYSPALSSCPNHHYSIYNKYQSSYPQHKTKLRHYRDFCLDILGIPLSLGCCPATTVYQLAQGVTIKNCQIKIKKSFIQWKSSQTWLQQSCGVISWEAFLSFSLRFHLVCSAEHKTESMVPFSRDLAQSEGERELET